jgi:hypothetical protein
MRKGLGTFWGIVFGIIFILVLLESYPAFSQCNLKAESKVEQTSSGKSVIKVKIISGSGALDFYLIDQKTFKTGPLEKVTKNAFELKDNFEVIFENVNPSIYTIQLIDNKKCQISIGGMKGILVSSN